MKLSEVEKIVKHAIKLSEALENISPVEVSELRKIDPMFDKVCDSISCYLGSSDPYWRIHPLYPHIRCSKLGEIEISGKKVTPVEINGALRVCWSTNKRKSERAADLVMACFDPCPGDRTAYRICYRDKDFNNINPNNLYWERIIVR
jgi:hypothetical protein